MSSRFRATRGLTFRLSLAMMVWFALSVAILLAIAYVFGVARPSAQIQSSIDFEARTLASHYRGQSDSPALVRALDERAASPNAHRAYHIFRDANGQVISANLPLFASSMGQRWQRFVFGSYVNGEDRRHEVLARGIRFPDGAGLLVGRDTEDLADREEFITEAAGWGGGLTLALGLAGGFLISAAVGRRIDAVARTAERVIAGDLSGRVEVRGTDDDFDHLAETLNQMLARNEEMVHSISRVSDSISHELRTPLARLHADLARLSTQLHGSAAAREALIGQAVTDASRLQSTFDALLRIARIDIGRHTLTVARLDLTELLRDAVDLYAPLAEENGQLFSVSIQHGLVVMGDRDLLFQAITNLIDNALKYTPAGGHISLDAHSAAAVTRIKVADNGPGVSPSDLPRIKERFFRAGEQQADNGLGLGLALAEAVVQRHQASLHFENSQPGLTAIIEIHNSL